MEQAIETKIQDFILSLPEIQELVDKRLYPMILPSNVTYPALTYTRISTSRSNRSRGSILYSPVIEFNIFAQAYRETKEVEQKMRNLLDGRVVYLAGVGQVTLFEINSQDVLDPETDLNRVITEYEVNYGQEKQRL